MKKSKPSKKGRPALGKKAAEACATRLPEETLAAVDAYARREGIATRSEAIRHLVERGLKVGGQST